VAFARVPVHLMQLRVVLLPTAGLLP